MQSNMKIFRYIATAIAAAAIFACSGTVDESSLPVLEVSDAEIDLASETQAVFTVTYNGTDVTDQSQIISTAEGLSANVFAPVAEGSATFYAVYNGLESNEVTVNVVNTDMKIESRFARHTLIAEFTGASCAFCPEGYDNMMLQLSKPAMASYKKNAHICAFHSEEMGPDSLAIEATMHIKNMFKNLDLPSYTIDFRDAGALNTDGLAGFNAALKASFQEHTPHCGVAVSSTLSEDGSSVEIKVNVTSELTSDYRVVLLVVQDRIVGYQKHGTYGEIHDYKHMHVVRQVVTRYAGSFAGEKITDDGKIAAGQEATQSWTVQVDRRWVLENTQIYALALDKDGYVNNMNVCAIDGGDSGYDLK